MSSRIVFRPWTGIALTVLVGAVVVVSLAGLVVAGDVESLLRFGPAFVTLGAGTAALFWWPAVVVDDAAVTVRNPFRTTVVPWARIDSIETRFGLKLVLDEGSISAWAGPSRSRRQSAALLRQSRATASKRADEMLARETSADGEAATYIRRELGRRARTGELPTGDVVRRPNILVIVVLSALVIASVLFPLA